MSYQPVDRMEDPPLPDCLFCKRISVGMFLLDSDQALVFRDAFPVSPGHVHVVPRRHVADFFDLAPYERDSLWDTVIEAVDYLQTEHSPDGFNIGINIGAAAGQSIPHTSIHIIPRYMGDGEPAGMRWVRGGKKSSYSAEDGACHFCQRLPEGDEGAVLLPDSTPIAPGHSHIVPRQHEESFLLLPIEGRDTALDLLEETVQGMRDEDTPPDGFNLGLNIGQAAGQGVPHTSIHIVPRRWDDAGSKAGLRWVRGGKQADVDRHG